jgi:hypothetical protein
VWLAAGRDIFDRIETAPPCFGHAAEVSGRMLSPHQQAPELLG